MTVLGNVALFAGLCSAILSAVVYYRSATSRKSSPLPGRLLLVACSVSVLLASLVLLDRIVAHDYSVGYVYSYSDNTLPLHFLISSFYAGQEGSFLFWALCSAVIGLFLHRSAKRSGIESPVMAVFMTVEAFLILLVVVRSPFRSVWEMFPGAPASPPPDGRGLNPLLQNIWMVIHPPVLFIGFAAMAVPFSMAVAGLWKKKSDLLPANALSWLLFSVAVLGLGIMLGAYWAYGVLGWGGYWGWDPVENSSLVPWLTGVALLHTLLAQKRTGAYVRTNFALALLSFTLVLYSTFLTRSGVLGDASVHAFTDPGAQIYWLLLCGLIAATAGGAALLLLRAKTFRVDETRGGILTRETALGLGSLALLLSAAVVLFGTSLPILSKTRVEPAFYDATNLPIAIAVALLIGFSLFMQWEVPDAGATIRASLTSLGAAALSCLVLVAAGIRDAGALLLIFTALFALFVNVMKGALALRGGWRVLGGKVAHAGIAVFLLGVIASGRFAAKEEVALRQYTPQTVLGRSMTYTGSVQRHDGSMVFNISVMAPGESYRLSPAMAPAGEQGVLRTPDIASSFMRDVYVSPVGLESANVTGASTAAPVAPESLVVDASVKPLISLLWGGTLVMMAGFVLAFVKRSKES